MEIRNSKYAMAPGEHIDERFLRYLWSRQELRGAHLKTPDGLPIQVLDAGALNSDGGPDVRNARIRIGPVLFAGDVEIHRNLVEWHQHRHQNDPAYNKVILHVVLAGDPARFQTFAHSGRRIPILILEPFLTESLEALWRRSVLEGRAQRAETIPCFDQNNHISGELLASWIRKLAIERIELKLRRFEERLRELAQEKLLQLHEPWGHYRNIRREGFPEEIPTPELSPGDLSHRELWEQVLYEGIMDGLGYSKNRGPFVRLARIVTVHLIRSFKLEAEEKALQSVLFGVANLLPRICRMKEGNSRTYVRVLVRSWNEFRKKLRIERLHPAEWQFFPTRPANFPTIRIAAASWILRKILNGDLFREVIQCFKSQNSAEAAHARLRMLLHISADDFWTHHFDFDTPTKRSVNPLGISRIDDIICNTIIPLSLLYARVFKDLAVREGAIRLFDGFPALSENSITRLMASQLLRGKIRLETMSRQQGVIQLYRYYCRESRCGECEIGKKVFVR